MQMASHLMYMLCCVMRIARLAPALASAWDAVVAVRLDVRLVVLLRCGRLGRGEQLVVQRCDVDVRGGCRSTVRRSPNSVSESTVRMASTRIDVRLGRRQ